MYHTRGHTEKINMELYKKYREKLNLLTCALLGFACPPVVPCRKLTPSLRENTQKIVEMRKKKASETQIVCEHEKIYNSHPP